ncbi:MAG: NYN domain-containing protein [Anaerolineae bacterium]|nr:NYN domain-containing protein [Anaerolineae bacterium]
MPLLVDGHNLIGRMPDISLADPRDEAELVLRLRRYCWRHRRRATVVFDSGPTANPTHALSSSEIKVIFAPVGKTADDVIIQRLARARDPRGLIVVSSDHHVQAAARARGARVLPAETFAAELEPAEPDASEKPAADDDLEMWLKLFDTEP